MKDLVKPIYPFLSKETFCFTVIVSAVDTLYFIQFHCITNIIENKATWLILSMIICAFTVLFEKNDKNIHPGNGDANGYMALRPKGLELP